MTPTISEHSVRDEVWIQNDLLTRAIAAAIVAEALQMAAHCQVNRVHRFERGDDIGPALAVELSGKKILDVTQWVHGWMLAPRPEATMRAGIYQHHQETVSNAVNLALTHPLLVANFPYFGIHTRGSEENFELWIAFV